MSFLDLSSAFMRPPPAAVVEPRRLGARPTAAVLGMNGMNGALARFIRCAIHHCAPMHRTTGILGRMERRLRLGRAAENRRDAGSSRQHVEHIDLRGVRTTRDEFAASKR